MPKSEQLSIYYDDSIIIPKSVMMSRNLVPREKLFYGILNDIAIKESGGDSKTKCVLLSDKELKTLTRLKKPLIDEMLSKLESHGFISKTIMERIGIIEQKRFIVIDEPRA